MVTNIQQPPRDSEEVSQPGQPDSAELKAALNLLEIMQDLRILIIKSFGGK